MSAFSILIRMPLRRAPSSVIALVSLAGMLATAAPGSAQVSEPIGRFVFDAHVSLARYDQTNQVADSLNVKRVNLPTRGRGLSVGAHVYPFRWRKLTVGVGASAVWSSGNLRPVDANKLPIGPRVETKLAAFAPQVSFNFGSGNGWSYISGGLGTAIYTMRLTAKEEPERLPRQRAIHFGAGARWFAKPHIGFSFDLRWYTLAGQEWSEQWPLVPPTTRMVVSAGVSIK